MSDERGIKGFDFGCLGHLAVTRRSGWTYGGILTLIESLCQTVHQHGWGQQAVPK